MLPARRRRDGCLEVHLEGRCQYYIAVHTAATASVEWQAAQLGKGSGFVFLQPQPTVSAPLVQYAALWVVLYVGNSTCASVLMVMALAVQSCLRFGCTHCTVYAAVQVMYDADMHKLLPKITCPALVVVGEKDFR